MDMEKNKHFIVGIYSDEDVLKSAVKGIRKKGVKIHEVYTPYPIHGLEHALGYKESNMPVAAFLFGLLGTCLAIAMQVGMIGVDWPMIIGGKPNVSIPDFVPITFELTVLLGAFGMVGTFMVTNNLKPYKVPRIFDIRATDDKHVMAIDLANNHDMSYDDLKAILEANSAEEVFRREFETDSDEESGFGKYVADLFKNGVTRSSRLD